MFSGVGGFELGLQRAGVDHELVGYCEWDKYASQIYDKHFPGVKNYDDATTIVPDELPEFELLTGGFPCQSFSVAGKRRGFLDDTRGTLFFDIARVLSARRPRYLVLENVKGLLNHDEGRTFDTILGVLSDIGYDVQWEVLNSRYLGVPQNRERVYIVGHLRADVGSRPEVFPVTEPSGQPEPCTIVEPEKSAQDQHGVAVPVRLQQSEGWYGTGSRIRSEGEPTTPLKTQNNQGVALPVDYTIIDKKGVKKQNQDYAATLAGGAHSGGNHSDMDLIGITEADENGTSFYIRRLTPTECERLQSFPDGWTEGISNTQRYKQMGNAVTVNVVETVMRRLFGKEVAYED